MGSFSVQTKAVSLSLVPGSPSQEATADVHVHVATNAEQGYRLTVTRTSGQAGPAKGQPHVIVRPKAGYVSGAIAREHEVGDGAAIVDSSGPAPPTELELEVVVKDDFTLDPGVYSVQLQFDFQPRYRH